MQEWPAPGPPASKSSTQAINITPLPRTDLASEKAFKAFHPNGRLRVFVDVLERPMKQSRSKESGNFPPPSRKNSRNLFLHNNQSFVVDLRKQFAL